MARIIQMAAHVYIVHQNKMSKFSEFINVDIRTQRVKQLQRALNNIRVFG